MNPLGYIASSQLKSPSNTDYCRPKFRHFPNLLSSESDQMNPLGYITSSQLKSPSNTHFFLCLGPKPLDTGSPDPRSSGRSWLPSLSGTLNACPTCFLHYKLLAPSLLGHSQLPTPSLPSILEGVDQSFVLSN